MDSSPLLINADFDQRVVIPPAGAGDWVPLVANVHGVIGLPANAVPSSEALTSHALSAVLRKYIASVCGWPWGEYTVIEVRPA